MTRFFRYTWHGKKESPCNTYTDPSQNPNKAGEYRFREWRYHVLDNQGGYPSVAIGKYANAGL